MDTMQRDFYRQQLNVRSAAVYDHMLMNIRELALHNGITIRGTCKSSVDDVYMAYFALRNDRPEYFFLDKQLRLEVYPWGKMTASYPKRFTESQIFRINNLLRKEVSDILEKTYDSSIYIREEKIYAEIAVRYRYGGNGLYAHDLSGLLVFRQAVCEGLSKLLVLTLREAGIPAIEVRGSMFGVGHSWTAAYIGGNKYHLDVTQDLRCNSFGVISRRYFNLSEPAILRDHTINSLQEEVRSSLRRC